MYRNLLAEIVRNNIKKDYIAKILGKSVRAVERKLDGECAFTVPEAKKIMKIFPNCSFDYLFDESVNKNPEPTTKERK